MKNIRVYDDDDDDNVCTLKSLRAVQDQCQRNQYGKMVGVVVE